MKKIDISKLPRSYRNLAWIMLGLALLDIIFLITLFWMPEPIIISLIGTTTILFIIVRAFFRYEVNDSDGEFKDEYCHDE